MLTSARNAGSDVAPAAMFEKAARGRGMRTIVCYGDSNTHGTVLNTNNGVVFLYTIAVRDERLAEFVQFQLSLLTEDHFLQVIVQNSKFKTIGTRKTVLPQY